jgi:hypothetical protein
MSNNADFYVWTTNMARHPNACQYYRIQVPFRSLDTLGLAQTYEDTGEHPQEALQAMLTSNIVHMYSVSGSTALHKARTIRDMKAGDLGGRMMIPPAVIYDCDDNTDFVHPFNRTFAYLGVRNYPDARLLKPFENLEWADQDGNKTVCWKHEDEDGPATHSNGIPYDVERNLAAMKERHELIRTCHGATASTRALAQYYEQVIGQKNTYVYPNTVILEDYEPQFEVIRKDPDEIRILWQGSESHYVDWYPLRDAIKVITEKYPKVKWVIFGQWFKWVHDIIPDDRVEHHGWTAYEAFKLKRGLMNIDINLCVLANNAFNRCKSAIKWYEGSIWNRPEATLAANVEPYHEIEAGVTGMLYNDPADFVEKLSAMIENPELCRTLAENAKKWVIANRTPEKTAPGLFEFYQDCANRRRREAEGPLIVAPTQDQMKKVLARRR